MTDYDVPFDPLRVKGAQDRSKKKRKANLDRDDVEGDEVSLKDPSSTFEPPIGNYKGCPIVLFTDRAGQQGFGGSGTRSDEGNQLDGGTVHLSLPPSPFVPLFSAYGDYLPL
ncbi:hypothetical protein HAX54_038382 [Datura stramonium]|uniref:Uncharacterized protein n=1 Tax=Datura stramonium TaxID=4076 RepID=A0ABS8SHW3_DATST|nr:hypothetical protein [Datura stramonium]